MISKDCQDSYWKIRRKVHDMYFHWSLYCQLYSNSMRLNMLNKTAKDYFLYAEKCHIFYVISAICKLLDNAYVAGQKTLTFDSLIHDIKTNKICTCELEKELDKLKKSASNIIKDRNKEISHYDHKKCMKTSNNHLTSSLRDIKNTIIKMRHLLDSIEKCIQHVNNKYDWNADIHAIQIIQQFRNVLKKALLYDKNMCKN